MSATLTSKSIVATLLLSSLALAGQAEANRGGRWFNRTKQAPTAARTTVRANTAAARPTRVAPVSTPLVRETRAKTSVLDLSFKAPTSLSKAEREQGLHLNRISGSLAGSSHFDNWWEVVGNNTEFVIAQGNAYKGKSVTVNGIKYDSAEIVFKESKAGLENRRNFDVAGKAGEAVRVVYWRTSENAKFAESNGNVNVTNTRPHQDPAGDLHWRDIKVTIEKTATAEAAPYKGKFNYYQRDQFLKDGRDTRGEKSFLKLGGEASEANLRSKRVTPIYY